jgi:UDP-2,3-diacylglucosamine hydrolase
LKPGKKIYFASDFHLGIPDHASSLEREKRIVRFLETARNDAAEIFLVGDLFDFWFEYELVVPKGFVRLLGKIAEITDSGIPVHVFHGNHDLWMFGYLEKELGCKVHSRPLVREIAGKTFFIGHGDGLGPGQKWFNFILSIYRNRLFQRLFAFFHPQVGMGIANKFSERSRRKSMALNSTYYGDDKEFHILFAKEYLKESHVDYFVLGHRHLPMVKPLGNSSTLINLGDWITYNTYAVFDGTNVELMTFNG